MSLVLIRCISMKWAENTGIVICAERMRIREVRFAEHFRVNNRLLALIISAVLRALQCCSGE
jgi:hypothetical protein